MEQEQVQSEPIETFKPNEVIGEKINSIKEFQINPAKYLKDNELRKQTNVTVATTPVLKPVTFSQQFYLQKDTSVGTVYYLWVYIDNAWKKVTLT